MALFQKLMDKQVAKYRAMGIENPELYYLNRGEWKRQQKAKAKEQEAERKRQAELQSIKSKLDTVRTEFKEFVTMSPYICIVIRTKKNISQTVETELQVANANAYDGGVKNFTMPLIDAMNILGECGYKLESSDVIERDTISQIPHREYIFVSRM